MAVQSGNDEGTVEKDMSYSPSSGRETERAQADPTDSKALDDDDIDQDAVKSLPGEGGPDDVGDVEVDVEEIRSRIAERGRP